MNDESIYSHLHNTLIEQRRIDGIKAIRRNDSVSFLQFDVHLKSKVSVLMTDGFSEYKMPVSEKHEGKERVELYFCLPDYWDLNDTSNPNMNWVFHWLNRLVKHATEKQSWYGHGHTLYCGTSTASLSGTMKQDYFLFLDPMLLQKELMPIEVSGTTIHFLAVIPLFKNEFEYKQRK